MTLENDFFEQVKLFLPKYLTPEESRQLYSELSKFPDNMDFFLERADLQDQLLQGAGWRGFIAIEFSSGARKVVSGVILSNSCDISPVNFTDLPVNVLFAPLISLDRFSSTLYAGGKSLQQIDSILVNIRKQRVTNVFYLPGRPPSVSESVILLDDVHAHPLQHFISQERAKLFTLNQYAFYLFLIKLSIHFSRFQEGVRRFSDAA